MKFNRSDVAALKKLVLAAKNFYYNEGRVLRIKLSTYSPEVATALKLGKLSKSAKPILPEEATISRGMLDITDARYDLLEKIIQETDPKWQPISGAQPVVGKVKVKLPVALSSLDKAYPGDSKVANFSKKNSGSYVVSDKLDGNALELVYEKGRPPKAYTKTSSTIGQDVSFLVPHMDIPQRLKEDCVVRAETILPKNIFASKYSKTSEAQKKYKNARNMVAGIFNTKGVHEAVGDIHVVTHELMTSSLKPSAQLKKLKQLGFSVVNYVVANRLSDTILSSILKKRKASSRYMIDGLVITHDKARTIKYTGENPTHSIAFKENDIEENLAEAKVLGVEWNVSKHGLLKPRVNITPVELAGATVEWVTAHNAKYVYDNKIGKGAVIQLTRSGEVIPYITSVVKPALKPDMPDVPYVWNETRVDLILTDTDNSEIKIKRITSFLRDGLGVERLSTETVRKCYEAGWTSVKTFLTAKAAKFMTLPGVKETSAFTYYNQIQTGCKNANLAAVAAHSGFFGRLFATKRMQMIVDKFDLYKLATMSPVRIAAKVQELEGFSEKTSTQFAKGLPKFIKWVQTLPLTYKKAEKVVVTGSSMQGQAICFTGFRNENLENAIKRQGGTIATGVNSKTTILVVKDKGSSSSKAAKAKELGIPIYTADELVKKYKNLIF